MNKLCARPEDWPEVSGGRVLCALSFEGLVVKKRTEPRRAQRKYNTKGTKDYVGCYMWIVK